MTLQIENLCSILEQHLLEGSDFSYNRKKKEWTLYDINGFPITSAHSIYGVLTTLYFDRSKPNE